jgi:tRNA-uridine 2-sulfurtransferase
MFERIMKNKKEKVLVCMSGGVDSSVAAVLLLKEGYDVTGAFMKQWSDTHNSNCSWKQDRRDALRVTAKLDIPLITLDFEKEYKEWVMDYMFKEYEAGRTPNPDVLCNKYIKFGVWLSKARELGFSKLATGHYARFQREDTRNKVQDANKLQFSNNKDELRITNYELRTAKDQDKDQTYFLHQLNQEQLSHTLFPIGDYLKTEVRSLAKKFDLPTAEREESMGICFVGEVPMKEFLKTKIKTRIGKIVMSTGEIIGKHEGMAFYTIGQRHLAINQGNKKAVKQPNSKPVYVVAKDIKKNELVVGYEDDPLLFKKETKVSDLNWISGHEPEYPLKCKVRLRHRQALQACLIKTKKQVSTGHPTSGKNKKTLTIEFEKPQRAITPGQFAVFYQKDVCLGGGVIHNS